MLPAPVRSYFDFALSEGQRMIEAASIQWEGEFAVKPRHWSAFTAKQHYRMHPPGFVWDARIQMTSILPVLVRDTYMDHVGSLRAAIGGVVRVADQHGAPELAAGELLRYLGEAVWYPTALLPSAGVTWSAIDHRSAAATLTDGETSVSMVAHFAPTGEITSITAMRPREVKGVAVLTPWVAYLEEYSARDGMQVPVSGTVEWVLPTGRFPYWRGTLIDVHYDFER